MNRPHVLVTFRPSAAMRTAISAELNDVAEVAELPEDDDDARARALDTADAVLAWMIRNELREDEFARLRSAQLVQLMSAGADRVPFDLIPASVPVASNAGAYALPMAEHVLAMALALAKRLPQNHAGLARGEFDQRTLNLEIRGALVGVLGFGGIGQASARLFKALGARVHALNRSGQTDEPVDAITTLADLDAVLVEADILVIALPLTRATQGLIGQRELALMKPGAILINVARAGIVDEDALYEHLANTPTFSAGIDTWWQEPRDGAAFTTRRPFLELPNVIGSPHNSAITAGAFATAARQAAANVARVLRGEIPEHLVERAEYG